MAPAPVARAMPGYIAFSGMALALVCLTALGRLAVRTRSSFALGRTTDATA
jgi:hypothetical protein